MTPDETRDLPRDTDERWRRALAAVHADESLPASVTESVLAAAQAATVHQATASPPVSVAVSGRSRWARPPLALAASFAAGLVCASLFTALRAPHVPDAAMQESPALSVPVQVLRGTATATSVPVEQADPDQWYRYIQELLLAGRLREAEAHLRRFNELHPDYAPPPQ